MLSAPRFARPRTGVRPLGALLLGGLCWLLWASAPSAQDTEAAPRDGLFISVDNQITDQTLRDVERKVKQAVDRGRQLDIIVFDFNPRGAPSGTTSFGICYALADYIRSLSLGQAQPGLHPRTVAFIHNQVTNHSVLPVLACSQLVMSKEPDETTQTPKARLGPVLYNVKGVVKDKEKEFYEELAQAQKIASPDLVRRMLEPNLPLVRVETDRGVRYATPARVAKWKAEGLSVAVKKDVPAGLEPGRASFDAEKAFDLGLCKAFYNSRKALCEALKLPSRATEEDWFSDEQRVAWRIDVTGTLDKGRLDSLRRRVHHAIGRGANFVLLYLNTSGGDTAHVAALADELRQLTDRSGVYPVRTVAYVPPGVALGAGAYLALARNEIVMASDATLADFNYLRQDSLELLRRREEMLLPLARDRDLPELIFKAALTPNLALYRVRAANNPNEERLITEAEYRADQEGAKRWRSLGRIAAPEGELLTITAERARDLRIAQATDVDSLDQLYSHYHLKGRRVWESRDDLLDRVAEFFREPVVNFILIMLGIVGLILELKLPGTTVPGALAAICFVLFFWAYSFVGEFTMLAVLLFLLGLILIAVEIFLVPGLGFSGVAGVGLVITSLVLVTLERWPQTSQDWVRLGGTLTTLALSLVAALAAAFTLAWFLPSMPYFSRLVLAPPEEDPGEASAAGAAPLPGSLLGAIGAAATPLRPAGKAQFGDDFLDVIAEGDYVNAGSRVQVIEIEGNRIVVKEV